LAADFSNYGIAIAEAIAAGLLVCHLYFDLHLFILSTVLFAGNV
jgi:hypothetical protein